MDASDLTQQTLQSSAAKALKGLNLAQEYMSYGFTMLRDLGSMDPQFPTVDLRNALNAGPVNGPRLVVADGAAPDHHDHQHAKQVHQVKRYTEKQQPAGGPTGLETSQPFIRPRPHHWP